VKLVCVCVCQVQQAAVRSSSGVQTGNASPADGFVTMQTIVETEVMSFLRPAVSHTLLHHHYSSLTNISHQSTLLCYFNITCKRFTYN